MSYCLKVLQDWLFLGPLTDESRLFLQDFVFLCLLAFQCCLHLSSKSGIYEAKRKPSKLITTILGSKVPSWSTFSLHLSKSYIFFHPINLNYCIFISSKTFFVCLFRKTSLACLVMTVETF